MRVLAAFAVAFLVIQLTLANYVVNTPKQCKDFLPESTCQSLELLASTLKEASTTVQDAINAGVKAHIQSSKDMLEFVRNYIDERIDCASILSDDMCTVLDTLTTHLKITKKQLHMAIEMAVNGTKATTAQIYAKILDILQEEINCELVLGKQACDNMDSALDKLQEQRTLIKEAIMSVALKHLKNTKIVLGMVQEELIERMKNFGCASVLPNMVCDNIVAIASRLKVSAKKVHEAIGLALLNGITKVNDIKNFVMDFITNQINCENILTELACNNLLEATAKLHEQSKLIKEALMLAAQEKLTDAKDILNAVKTELIKHATNFNCTDVLPERQCIFLANVADRLKLRKDELQKVLIIAVVNGIQSANDIYDATIRAFIEDAKSVQCSDLIDPQVCSILLAFSAKLGESVNDVTDAVKKAIAQGLSTNDDILAFVRQLLVDEKSCQDFFHSRVICTSLSFGAWLKGVTFDRVIARIRSIYASGVTSARAILQRIKDIFGISISKKKRSLGLARNELVDLAMQFVSGMSIVTDKMKQAIKRELYQLIDSGKMSVFNMYSKVKELINKYNPLSDEFEDEVPSEMKGMSELYKAARVALKQALMKLVAAAKKAGIESKELMRRVADIYKSGIADFDEIMTSF